MRSIILYFLACMLFLGCKKEHQGTSSKVEIYMLQSFDINVNQTTNPAVLTISNAVLADMPLVADEDIAFYTKSTTIFRLKKEIKAIIRDYGADKAFAVTVDKQPVYFGRFHPAYLSSMTIGLATIDPIFFINNDLKIQFVTIQGNAGLQQLDKRNDELIINSLKASGRLR